MADDVNATFTNSSSSADITTESFEAGLEAVRQILKQRIVTGIVLNPRDYHQVKAELPETVVPSVTFGRAPFGILGGLSVFADPRIPSGRKMELYNGETVEQGFERLIKQVSESVTQGATP